jgi:hypothetical protein
MNNPGSVYGYRAENNRRLKCFAKRKAVTEGQPILHQKFADID